MAKIQDYARGVNTLPGLKKAFASDTLNVETNYKLAKKHLERWEIPEAQKYFTHILKYDAGNVHGYNEESTLNNFIYKLRYETDKDPQPLIRFLHQTQNVDFLKTGYSHLRRFYKNEKDTVNYFATCEESLLKLSNDVDLMNEYAWAIYSAKKEEKYDRGVELAEKAVAMESESAGIWDTLAWLYFEKGEYPEAISAMKKAVKYNSGFKNRLKKLESAIKDKK